jgi:hypothetical protein
MPACPNCLFGVGILDETCAFCGEPIEAGPAAEAVDERARLVPKPPYQLWESVIPIVLCIGGVAAIAAGAIFSLTLMGGGQVSDQDAAKLTVMVANGAVCLAFGLWAIVRQRARYHIITSLGARSRAR